MKIKWPGWGYLAWVVWGRSGSGVDFPRSVNTLYLIQALWVRPSQVTVNCIPCFVSVENTVFADLSISRIKTKLQPNNKQHSSKIIRGEILTFWAAKSRDIYILHLSFICLLNERNWGSGVRLKIGGGVVPRQERRQEDGACKTVLGQTRLGRPH